MLPRRFEAYLFDLDGVLVDSYECWQNLLNGLLRQMGRPPVSRQDFDASWGQGPDADQRMFFPDWTVPEVIDAYNRSFEKYVPFVRVEPGAQRLLECLKGESRLVGVASNSPTPIVRSALRQAGLLELVEIPLGVEQVKQGKPAPDLILELLGRMNVDSANACYVGDSVFDLEAAKQAQVYFVGYKRAGDCRIETLEDLLL